MSATRALGWQAVRWRGWSLSYRRGVALRTAVVVVFVLALGAYSLSVGTIAISADQLWHVLTGRGDMVGNLVVLEWRLPRVLTALTVGAALGVAGALVQTITRNPLGSPDVIGFSSGSYFGVLVVVVLLQGSSSGRSAGALVGGFAAAALVWMLAWRRGVTGFRLIVVGIGVSTMLTGLTSWLVLASDQNQYRTFTYWTAGSLQSLTWGQVRWPLILLAVLLLASLRLGRPLQQLELGDLGAQSRGLRVEWVRGIALAVGILLTALVTIACGPIEFVALAAPQIARRVVGLPGIGLASSAAMGALLMLTADFIGGHLLPVELPAGVVTLVFGGAYLTVLLLRETRRR